MKTQRAIIFLLALLITAGRLAFDCGCVYAAPQSLKSAQEAAMPCHGHHPQGKSANQESSCCGGCKEVRYAVSPKTLDFTMSLERTFFADPALDFIWAGTTTGHFKEPFETGQWCRFSAVRLPMDCPIYLSLQTLLI